MRCACTFMTFSHLDLDGAAKVCQWRCMLYVDAGAWEIIINACTCKFLTLIQVQASCCRGILSETVIRRILDVALAVLDLASESDSNKAPQRQRCILISGWMHKAQTSIFPQRSESESDIAVEDEDIHVILLIFEVAWPSQVGLTIRKMWN